MPIIIINALLLIIIMRINYLKYVFNNVKNTYNLPCFSKEHSLYGEILT